MKHLILLIFIPLISFSQSIDQEEDLPALRLSNNFSKPYRVLKTTISDKSLFQQYYNNMQCIKLTSCQIINCKDAYIRKLLRDEEAVCESSEYRSVRQLELIGQMFDRADADHSGGIDSSEFLSLITALEQNHLLRSNEDPNELFSRMDSDGSGEVDFQELSD